MNTLTELFLIILNNKIMEELGGTMLIIGLALIILPYVAIFIFFSQATNIKKILDLLEGIKKYINPDEFDLDEQAKRELYYGNKEKALELYQRMYYELSTRGERNQLRQTPYPERTKYAKQKVNDLGGLP